VQTAGSREGSVSVVRDERVHKVQCKDYIRAMGERRTMVRCKECGKLFEDLPTMANHFIDDHFDVVFDIIAGEFAEEVDVYVKNGRIAEVEDNETVSRSEKTQTLTKIFEYSD